MKTVHMPEHVAENLTMTTRDLLRAHIQKIGSTRELTSQNDPEGVLPNFHKVLEQYIWLKGNDLYQIDTENSPGLRHAAASYFGIMSYWVHYTDSYTFAQWCEDLNIPLEFRP